MSEETQESNQEVFKKCSFCANHPEEDHKGVVKTKGHKCPNNNQDHFDKCKKKCALTKIKIEKIRIRMEKSRIKNKSKTYKNNAESPIMREVEISTVDQKLLPGKLRNFKEIVLLT